MLPCSLKGGPEHLEKEIHQILDSKREDRFSDPFFDLVQNTSLVRFSYLFRLCNFCKDPRDMRKFPQECQKIAWCWGRSVYVTNQDSNQRPSGERAHFYPLNCVCIRHSKYLYNIPLKFWPFYYQWKWMKSKEDDQTRVPKTLPAEIKRWRLQEWFSNISVQLNFTGTKT